MNDNGRNALKKIQNKKDERILYKSKRSLNGFNVENDKYIYNNIEIKGKNQKMKKGDIKDINTYINKIQSFNELIIPNNNNNEKT